MQAHGARQARGVGRVGDQRIERILAGAEGREEQPVTAAEQAPALLEHHVQPMHDDDAPRARRGQPVRDGGGEQHQVGEHDGPESPSVPQAERGRAHHEADVAQEARRIAVRPAVQDQLLDREGVAQAPGQFHRVGFHPAHGRGPFA